MKDLSEEVIGADSDAPSMRLGVGVLLGFANPEIDKQLSGKTAGEVRDLLEGLTLEGLIEDSENRLSTDTEIDRVTEQQARIAVARMKSGLEDESEKE